MMKCWHRIFPILAAALVFYMVVPISDYTPIHAAESANQAVSNLETVDQDGNVVACDSLTEAQGGKLLGRIIPCISYTIEGATLKFTAAMIDMLKPVVFSFITFVVVMFGVKTLQVGEHDLKKDAFLLTFKIAMVLGMLELIPTVFVPQVYDVMRESQTIVVGALPADFHCDIENYGGANTPVIWKTMDCVMGKLYGFTTGANGGTNMLLGASVFGTLTGFFFGGAFGVTIFFVLIGVLVSLFMLVIRTAAAFINGYLIVCLMLVITPLFMPLILLRVTNEYFEKWWKNILAGLLMPIIITAYAMLAFQIYDKLLFDPGDTSLNPPRQPALINKLFDNDFMKLAQDLPRQLCDQSVTNDPLAVRAPGASQAAADKLFSIPGMSSVLGTLGSAGGNNLCAASNIPTLRLDKASPEFADQRKAFTQLFKDATTLLVVAFIVGGGLEQAMRLVSLLTGTSSAAASLSATTPLGQKLEGAMERAKNSMRSSFVDRDSSGRVVSEGGVTGAEFTKRLLPSVRNGASSFLQTMRK